MTPPLMLWLPIQQETLVLPYTQREVVRKLYQVTYPTRSEDPVPVVDEDFLFNGWVRPAAFRLSQKIKRPNNFLPTITGSIEATRQGCIIFLRYRLFSATIMLLSFWLLVTFSLAAYFLFYEKIYSYALVTFLVGIMNYWVTVANFNKQVKISSQMLKQALS